jgi:hypothetical protein
VTWQVWMALLVYVLLRFLAWRGRWAHSFSRLLTLLRAALWMKRDIAELLRRCGTAPGDFRCLNGPIQTGTARLGLRSHGTARMSTSGTNTVYPPESYSFFRQNQTRAQVSMGGTAP